MDAQIYAAIVGGLIGGAALAGGVILNLRVRSRQERRTERRRRLEAVVDQIASVNLEASQVAIIESFDLARLVAANVRISELTGHAMRLADAAGGNEGDQRSAADDLSDMWLAMLLRARTGDYGRPEIPLPAIADFPQCRSSKFPGDRLGGWGGG